MPNDAQQPLFDEMIKRALAQDPGLAAQVDPSGTDTTTASHGSKLATLLYLAGLGADVGTTAVGAARGTTTEANPLFKWAGPKAAAPLVAGTSIASALLARKLLKSKHPTLLNGLLSGMGAAHGIAALSNVGQMRKGAAMMSAPGVPSVEHPNLVQAPDGSWYDPGFVTVK